MKNQYLSFIVVFFSVACQEDVTSTRQEKFDLVPQSYGNGGQECEDLFVGSTTDFSIVPPQWSYSIEQELSHLRRNSVGMLTYHGEEIETFVRVDFGDSVYINTEDDCSSVIYAPGLIMIDAGDFMQTQLSTPFIIGVVDVEIVAGGDDFDSSALSGDILNDEYLRQAFLLTVGTQTGIGMDATGWETLMMWGKEREDYSREGEIYFNTVFLDE